MLRLAAPPNIGIALQLGVNRRNVEPKATLNERKNKNFLKY